MARAIWDGQKIVIDASRLDLDRLKQLAEKYKGELLVGFGYSFDRSVDFVLELITVDNIVIDQSLKPIVDKVKQVQQKKLQQIQMLNLPDNLYLFQKQAISQMVQMQRNILLASAPGCGKSCMSALYLAKKPDSYPALVICPASLKINWQMEFFKWTPEIKTFVINGRESYNDQQLIDKAKQADIVIVNYDILGKEDKQKAEAEKNRIAIAKENGWKYRKAFIPVKGWVDVFNEQFSFHTVVCDECQFIESSKAIRTRAVIQLTVDKSIKKLFLSGTPFETKVRQFYNACHILAPDMFPDEYKFLYRYCDPKHNGFGWQFNGLSNVEELRQKLSLFMIRHRKEDVLSQLPAKQKIPIYLEMDKKFRKQYDDLEQQMLESKDGLPQLQKLAELKSVLAEIKIEPTVQYIKDMLEIEDKIVVFVYHKSTYQALMEKFKGQAVGINGDTPVLKRQPQVIAFQNDPNIKLFIGQVQAASTGLTLTASHVVIFTEWGQTVAQMEQASDRIHRIGQTADRCLIYYLIVKDTVDEGPVGNLNAHAADIDAVLDGKTDSSFLDVDDAMIAKVKQRKLMRNKQAIAIEYQ